MDEAIAPHAASAVDPDAMMARILAKDTAEGLPALRFDPEEFMHFVDRENLTDAQARILLGEIWKIVVAFVDLGFNLHPIQQVRDKSRIDDVDVAEESVEGVSLKDDFSAATRQDAVARPNRRARPGRDS